MDKIEISVPGKVEYLTTLRLLTGSIAHNANFDIEDIEDLKTCVSEAFKLIYCHNKDCWISNILVEYFLR